MRLFLVIARYYCTRSPFDYRIILQQVGIALTCRDGKLPPKMTDLNIIVTILTLVAQP